MQNWCKGECEKNADTWSEKMHYGIRRTLPTKYECYCFPWGSTLGTAPSTHCNYGGSAGTVQCNMINSWAETFYDSNSLLMGFLSSTDELEIKDDPLDNSADPNLCNDNRHDDIAAAYLVTTFQKASTAFYSHVFDKNASFVYKRLPLKIVPISVQDPVIMPVYRRVHNVVNDYYLYKQDTHAVRAHAQGIYHHCTLQRQDICPSASSQDHLDFCFQVFKIYQAAYIALSNKKTAISTTIPAGCYDLDLVSNGFVPISIAKRYIETEMKLSTSIVLTELKISNA